MCAAGLCAQEAHVVRHSICTRGAGQQGLWVSQAVTSRCCGMLSEPSEIMFEAAQRCYSLSATLPENDLVTAPSLNVITSAHVCHSMTAQACNLKHKKPEEAEFGLARQNEPNVRCNMMPDRRLGCGQPELVTLCTYHAHVSLIIAAWAVKQCGAMQHQHKVD